MKREQYQAAGGIVARDGQVMLLRKRTRNEMVLPKGHVEAGERLEDAALREVREETGYQNLRLLANLGTRRAEFQRDDTWVVRDETYFLMELLDDQRQAGQDHDDAEFDRQVFERHWVPLDSAADLMSFEPARTFVRLAADWMKKNRTETPPAGQDSRP